MKVINAYFIFLTHPSTQEYQMTKWQPAGASCPTPPEDEAQTMDISTAIRWQVDTVVQLSDTDISKEKIFKSWNMKLSSLI